MKCIFKLSQDHLELARLELERLEMGPIISEFGAFVVRDVPEDKIPLLDRIAYTKRVLQYYFHTPFKELDSAIESCTWDAFVKGAYVVRCFRMGLGEHGERDLAGKIWYKLSNPAVSVKKADTTIQFYRDGDTVFCGALIATSEANFQYRRNQYKPRMHPTTMHPKFARLLINLTGQPQGKLLDPFCGAGGILLEAGVLGYDAVGFDISDDMLERCNENLTHFKIKKYRAEKRDATKDLETCDCIVTDLPYGRNSKVTDTLINMYRDFLLCAYGVTNHMTVVFPDWVDYKSVLGEWQLKHEASVFIHGSLTRKVTVLEK